MCFMNCPEENSRGECTVPSHLLADFICPHEREESGNLLNEEDNFHHQEEKE